MAEEFMPVVKADGVGALQPSHAAYQVGVGRLQHQMVMLAQQTIRVNLPIGFLAVLGQRFQEILPVNVIQEYILTSVTPAHDMIHRPPDIRRVVCVASLRTLRKITVQIKPAIRFSMGNPFV